MHREILISCLPFLGGIAVSVFVLRLLISVSGARLQLSQLRLLHRDEMGGVQSLSFVLTLPLFIMILMFIVQLSQLTIAKVVVEHAAFAAARSAIVWIPANEPTQEEWENQVGMNRVFLGDEEGENDVIYSNYQIEPGTAKFDKIHFAAAMACLPICPSRDVGADRDNSGMSAVRSLLNAYQDMTPTTWGVNRRVPARIANKLAYSLENTRVDILVRHKDEVAYPETEPPLEHHDRMPHRDEFAFNEIGWQDQLVVTVTHNFALLPGPARLLARRSDGRPGQTVEDSTSGGQYEQDQVAAKVAQFGKTYTYAITATVRLQNEGQKSVLPYYQNLNGDPGYYIPLPDRSQPGYSPYESSAYRDEPGDGGGVSP